MRVWLGTAGWSYFPDWVGPFYPPGTSQSDALARYCEAFRFVEVDSTFYAAPAPATVERWARIVPITHRLACKAPRELTQDVGLRVPEVPFGHFCGLLLDTLGPRLARVVAQMPPGFAATSANIAALAAFSERWGGRVPLAVELRHASWRTDATAALLRDNGVVWVGNDLQDVPDLGPGAHCTAPVVYTRLIGHHDGLSKDRLQRPQPERRAWWAEQLAGFALAGATEAFLVVNNHYEGHAPATLRTLAVELGAVRGPGADGAHVFDVVESPGFPDGQVTLF